MEGITHEYVFDPVWRDGKVIHRGKCRCGWIAIEWHNKANPAYNDWHQHFLDVKAGNQWKPSEPI